MLRDIKLAYSPDVEQNNMSLVQAFRAFDKNGDGFITQQEIIEASLADITYSLDF